MPGRSRKRDPRAQAIEAFKPLPAVAASPANPITPEKVALGRLLYFETRVSADGTVSCARRHQPTLSGTDGPAKSIGVHGRENPRNAPTVLNAALQLVEHWRGDRASVEDQATQALVGPPSFGNASDSEAMARLKAIPEYARLFARAFPGDADPVTAQNWGKAIGAYERTLLTPSPFDVYLGGDEERRALTTAPRVGTDRLLVAGSAYLDGRPVAHQGCRELAPRACRWGQRTQTAESHCGVHGWSGGARKGGWHGDLREFDSLHRSRDSQH